MKRLGQDELVSLLSCPDCCGDLVMLHGGLICRSCNQSYVQFKRKAVLLRESNELFPPSHYVDIGEKTPPTIKSMRQKIKSLIPGKSVNLARERMLERMVREHAGRNKVILVVGCGNQSAQLDRHFSDISTTFVFCDIDQSSDADIFCDSHELAFHDDVFDGLISTAVMEHVLYPEKVVKEFCRVLKSNGFIYSEIPFLQSVHEGAYDFTRYNMSGHRRLLNRFEEIDSGMVAGPGTALVWSIVDFSKSLSKSTRLSNLFAIAARIGFFWIKYFDYLMTRSPAAMDAASCTYFYGTLNSEKCGPAEIVAKYMR